MVINDIRFKGKHFRENKESKHWRKAMYGWYRYDSRFAIPVYRDDEEVERYNIFHASLIVRYSEDGKLYLYERNRHKKRNEQPEYSKIKTLRWYLYIIKVGLCLLAVMTVLRQMSKRRC